MDLMCGRRTFEVEKAWKVFELPYDEFQNFYRRGRVLIFWKFLCLYEQSDVDVFFQSLQL